MISIPVITPGYLAAYNGRRVIVVAIVMGVFEVVIVSLFFLGRYRTKSLRQWDVYLMIPAFIFCFGLVISSISMCTSIFTAINI